MKSAEQNNLENGKKLPFWKESSFVLWALPVVASVLAVFIDYGYLHYFDIPIAYAEINFYTAILISLFLVLIFLVIVTLFITAYVVSTSGPAVLKVLVRPYALLGCSALYFFARTGDLSTTPIYFLYIFYVVVMGIQAFFNKSTDKTFIEKFEQSVESLKSTIVAEGATSDKEKVCVRKIYDMGGKVFFYLLILMGILGGCEYIAAHFIDIWVLSDDDSVIAIKRNNDVYILKPFDKDTLILGEGFKVVKVGETPLKLKLMRPKLELKSLAKVQYKRTKEAQELQDGKDVEGFINSVKSRIDKIMEWAARVVQKSQKQPTKADIPKGA
jgi:hypothetical protein